MATKGYNNYHGRSNGKKTVAIIALLLIIIGAVGYLVMQNYIVYDDAGQAHLELPNRWKEKTGSAGLPEEDVTIEFVEPPAKWLPVQELHASLLPEGSLLRQPTEVLQEADEAIVIGIKRINGAITYAAKAEIPEQVEVGKPETAENLKTLLADDRYTIAHLYTLCDSYFVRAYHDAAFQLQRGGMWYDADGWAWLDPTNPNVLGYITALCKECAELGFDEITLDCFSYPTNGRMETIAIEEGTDRTAVLQSFAESIRNALPEGVVLSVVIRNGEKAESGLSAEMIAACFDRVYLAPDTDAEALLRALPEDYDRNVRVVQMAYQRPTSGSYVLMKP